MEQIILKNKRSIDIDIWNYEQFKSFAEKLPTYEEGSHSFFQGFTIFSPQMFDITRIWARNKNRYSDAKNLSPLEIQADRALPNEAYDRIIVALQGDNLLGYYSFIWHKEDYYNFWRYKTHVLEVKKDFRSQGIATHIIKTLDRADFIKNKILQLGMYTFMGEKYARKIIEKELKARDYVLLPEEYFEEDAPKRFGRYDYKGELINTTTRGTKQI